MITLATELSLSTAPPPGCLDYDTLGGFSRVAHLNVILNLRLIRAFYGLNVAF